MLNRDNIFKHAKAKFSTSPVYLWEKFPKYAVLKHESGGKWYGIIMNVHPEKLGLDGDEELDILDLKCPPEKSEELRDGEKILPGYHMHKEHWISIVLKRIDSLDEIETLIEKSFELTK